MKKDQKYIFVIGGVMSGVGKGIATSSISKLLQTRGFEVNPIKIDPYLNVDAGTMNPTEHGEVFVLKTGLECDQDMGNYERFLGIELKNENYMTSGMIYGEVLEKERNLGYRGRCVEAIPHIRDEIIRRIELSASMNGANITVVEIGGTVGDYQNILFIDAARVMKLKNPDDVIFVLVTYLPIPSKIGEMKTKPSQNAVRQLNSYGVQPDIIIARADVPLDKKRKEKIAMSCSVRPENVISAPDIESIYEVPLNFEKDELAEKLMGLLKIKGKNPKSAMNKWKNFVEKTRKVRGEVKIAFVGKYFDTGDFVLSDAYISVIESLKFSSYALGRKPVFHWLNSKDFESGKLKVSVLNKYQGIIVPGGFGEAGIEGKIKVIKHIRENKIPYLGLCYGMQLAIVEYARHVLGLKDANTVEINPDTKHPVIDIMPDQKEKISRKDYGGSMRLGSYLAILKRGSIAREAYGRELIEERHRHRFEVNPEYIDQLSSAGLVFSGISPDGKLMEIMELSRKVHPFFLGTQFHPEFKGHPLSPHPLFTEFLRAAMKRRRK